MYNSYLTVKKSRNGSGLFTTIEIPANIPIIEITGTIIPIEEIDNYNPDKVIQIGPYSYIGESGGIDDYINHSCNPNCKMHVVGNRAILYSLYVVPKNNELTFDYSTTSTDNMNEWNMQCNCGENNCRNIISGFQHLDKELQEKYKQNGMAALFLQVPFFTRKID